MLQRFDSRKYSVKDFEDWHAKGELVLAAKFQRRSVWDDKARSYLMDTIIRGKPIPKIYLRLEVNPKTRRTIREVVDGQQRLRSVLDFLADGFPIITTHNKEHGGRRFSQLEDETQRDILKYEFSVDLLQDIPDAEIYDIFARLDTYTVRLNPQELRNARYFGEFKTSVYGLATEFMTFWQKNNIFTDRSILRMAEAEFVSELLIAMSAGIQAKTRLSIDAFYRVNDETFSHRTTLEKRFRRTMDIIGGTMGDTLPDSTFRQPRLLYPLFCAVYHMKFGLPDMDCERIAFKTSDYPKLRFALGKIDEIFEKLAVAEEEAESQRMNETDPLLPEERKFHNACREHWVHAENRRYRTEYICRLMVDALRG